MDGDLLHHPWIRRRKLDVDEYHRMGEAGILGAEDRVELIEGELVAMAPIGPLHSGTSIDLNALLTSVLQGRALVSVGNPVRLDRHNEPQPDFTILRLRDGGYRSHVVTAADVHWAIELADSSLRFDRKVKRPLYAAHGIREYWLFDLAEPAVEVSRDPGPGGYATTTTHRAGERLASQAFPDLGFDVAALLGAAR